MAKQYKNKAHMAWVHEFPCILSSILHKQCRGPIQAHHLLRPWSGSRGMGMKASDRNVVPMCMKHHFELHKRGSEMDFFQEITGNSDFGKDAAKQYWANSPHNKDEKDD